MHILLTDWLSCPRCGPEFGLILLAREMRDRRILEGELGCSNCRENYPVVQGFGDLRLPPRRPLDPPPSSDALPGPDGETGVRMGAFLGLTEGPGTVLIIGDSARNAGALTDLVEGVEVVGSDPDLRAMKEREGVSRIVSGARIPFFNESLRGVVLSGRDRTRLLEEAVRVLAPMGRVVMEEAPEGARASMEELGLKVLLEEEGILVGLKEGRKSVPLTTLRVP